MATVWKSLNIKDEEGNVVAVLDIYDGVAFKSRPWDTVGEIIDFYNKEAKEDKNNELGDGAKDSL